MFLKSHYVVVPAVLRTCCKTQPPMRDAQHQDWHSVLCKSHAKKSPCHAVSLSSHPHLAGAEKGPALPAQAQLQANHLRLPSKSHTAWYRKTLKQSCQGDERSRMPGTRHPTRVINLQDNLKLESDNRAFQWLSPDRGACCTLHQIATRVPGHAQDRKKSRHQEVMGISPSRTSDIEASNA